MISLIDVVKEIDLRIGFSDTPKGMTVSALIYSLIETAKVNGREPYAWLCHVFERLPD